MKVKFKYGLIFCILHVSVAAALSLGDVITIRHADSLVGRLIDGETVRELTGNVELEQGGVLVFCDRAIHYPARNGAYLEGNVRVVDDTVTMIADKGYYDGDKRILEGEGNLFMDDGVSQLHADFGKYYIDEQIAEFRRNVIVRDPGGLVRADHLLQKRGRELSIATGNVSVTDRDQGTIVYGGILEYDRVTGHSIMREKPVLVRIDTTSAEQTDTLIVRSEIMESRLEDSLRVFVSTGDVRMHRSDLSARGGKSIYFAEEDKLTLTESPVLWYQNNQVTGDSIHVTLEERRLRRMDVYGRTFAASKSDARFPERFDQLTGMELTMWFKNDAIESIEVRDQATSLYYLYEDFRPNGLNRVTGDRIMMDFKEGDIHELKITGGIEGKYYPEKMVRGREQEYNLTGFQWIDERPQLTIPGIPVRINRSEDYYER